MQTYELYLVTNKINGKRYVGQTMSNIGYQSRWKDHYQEALRSEGHQCVFHSAIKGYGVDAFEVHRILKNIPETQIDFLESLWIKKLNTFYVDGHGYNMTLGGQGVHGYKHSDDTRKRISNTLKNREWRWTPELIAKAEQHKRENGYYERRRKSNWRNNLSNAAKKRFETEAGTFLGKHHTDEAKLKVSIANKGKKRSDKVKLNFVLQRGTPVAMCDKDSGEILKTFGALSIAQQYLLDNNLVTTRYATDGIRAACKNEGKVAYGFCWKFIEDVKCND